MLRGIEAIHRAVVVLCILAVLLIGGACAAFFEGDTVAATTIPDAADWENCVSRGGRLGDSIDKWKRESAPILADPEAVDDIQLTELAEQISSLAEESHILRAGCLQHAPPAARESLNLSLDHAQEARVSFLVKCLGELSTRLDCSILEIDLD